MWLIRNVTLAISNPFMTVLFSIKRLCSQVAKVSKRLRCIVFQRRTLRPCCLQQASTIHSIGQLIFSEHYSWLRVCTCNAEPSCSTAFSTGYASRRSSSYKSLEQLFRIHLGSVVQQGQRLVYYSCKMFPSLPPSLWRRRLGFVSAVPSSPLRLNLRSDFHQACWQRCRFISLPCEKRFFSCMAFSVYEVIRVACLSRGWFVYNACLFLTASNQTNYATGKPRE